MSGSAMTYSRMLAFRSQRAAFSPAAYGPSWCRISSIWKTAGSDSMSGMARMVAVRRCSSRNWLSAKKCRQNAVSLADSILGR